MKLIKLDRRYHGFPKWTHALQFTKREVHLRYREHAPYVKAFREIYGDDRGYNEIGAFVFNTDWLFDNSRRRIYFKDHSVMSFIELKIA